MKFHRLIILMMFYPLVAFSVEPVGQSISSSVIIEAGEYHYTVKPTGDNLTFIFDRMPPRNIDKIAAGYQLLTQVYADQTITEEYSKHYIRERARCYMYDSRFYTYSLCFLPNDFNRDQVARFWGFTSRVPNWKWLLTRILLPVMAVFGGVLFLFRR